MKEASVIYYLRARSHCMHYMIFRIFNSKMDYKSYEPIRYFIAFRNTSVSDEFRSQRSTVTAKEDNLILTRRSLTRSRHSHSQGREQYIWPFRAFWRFKVSKELAISSSTLKLTHPQREWHGIFTVYVVLRTLKIEMLAALSSQFLVLNFIPFIIFVSDKKFILIKSMKAI